MTDKNAGAITALAAALAPCSSHLSARSCAAIVVAEPKVTALSI